MAGQNIERREILRILAIAAGVAALPGFTKWNFACGHPQQMLTVLKPAGYQPLFFTHQEHASIERLTDIIIPSDETPGAREAGVAEFVDVMAARDFELQRNFRAGLNWLDAHSKRLYGNGFLVIGADQQTALLQTLAYKEKFRPGEEPGREFFSLLREYTVMGFYTSEIGLKELDFPGFKFYAESPACPHKQDPEHRHLPASRR
ncbi:MAG: gluconate 2-dehydrogenase subunit 3 family protein [Acidobacteria bacterium]|nr:gluconate 2-dehydrogenase subunit 3 family protein [Acidobacteriota bacterium]